MSCVLDRLGLWYAVRHDIGFLGPGRKAFLAPIDRHVAEPGDDTIRQLRLPRGFAIATMLPKHAGKGRPYRPAPALRVAGIIFAVLIIVATGIAAYYFKQAQDKVIADLRDEVESLKDARARAGTQIPQFAACPHHWSASRFLPPSAYVHSHPPPLADHLHL